MADDTALGTSSTSALDATTASADKTTASLAKVEAAAIKTKDAFIAHDGILLKFKSTVENAIGSYDEFLKTFQTTQQLSVQQVNQFNLLSTAMVGVRDSFKDVNLQGAGFVDQIKFITDTMGNSNGAIGALSGIISNTFGKVVSDSIKDSAPKLKTFAMQLAMGADNALRMRTEFINLSAATGNLDQIYKTAGPNLEYMNELLLRQKEMIGAASKSTLLSTDAIEKHYSSLATIPGALESVVSGTLKSGTSMNMLTAAIKLSQGSGREFKYIVDDLSTAFKQYGLTGESALQFSARMGDVSNNLGVDLASITSHLTSAASAFSRFADAGEAASKMSEGLAKITNDYVQALKASGMSGNHAIDVVKGMTDAIGGLNLQQKAFLSGQTGGPGGLMGAFQIEKMMREGNIEGVMKKMRDQMRQQFGKIVTLDEASSSQGAAAQMTRQITLLKSGPLGGMVKTDQDAYKMLESFKKMDEGMKITGLSSEGLQNTMDKGTMLQQSMATDLGVIRSITESQQGFSDITSLNLMQAFTGSKSTGDFAADSAATGGDNALSYKKGIDSRLIGSKGSEFAIQGIKQLQEEFKVFFPNIHKAVSGVTGQLHNPSDMSAIKAESLKLEEQIKIQNAALKKMPKEKQEAAKKKIAAEEYLLSQAKKEMSATTPGFPQPGVGSADEAYAPGSMLGTATTAALVKKPGTAAKPKGKGGADLGHETVPVSGSLDVTVHAICVKCHKEDAQGNAMHPIKK